MVRLRILLVYQCCCLFVVCCSHIINTINSHPPLSSPYLSPVGDSVRACACACVRECAVIRWRSSRGCSICRSSPRSARNARTIWVTRTRCWPSSSSRPRRSTRTPMSTTRRWRPRIPSYPRYSSRTSMASFDACRTPRPPSQARRSRTALRRSRPQPPSASAPSSLVCSRA